MSVSSLAFAHPFLAVSGFDYALQQPLFPGKILLWLLFMLSLLSWAVMISKAISFYRMRRADLEFNRQFQTARQPMALFERNYSDELSMQCLVYEHGAHEAAFQMLGSPDRDATFEARMESAEGMSSSQMKSVRDAFNRGEDAAAARIRMGLPILSVAAAGAPFLGLLGMVWILMRTFSSSSAAEGLSAISPGIAGGLAIMVVALLVATPAIFGQILIAAQGRERLRQLGGFKDEALRLMERFYLSGSAEVDRFEEMSPASEDQDASVAHAAAAVKLDEPMEIESMGFVLDDSTEAEEEGIEEDFVQDEMPLEPIVSPFEAIEEETPETEPEQNHEPEQSPNRRPQFNTPFSEPEINPIAQQTAGLLAGGTA